MRDLHTGLQLQQQTLGCATGCGVSFLRVEHQWSKTDFGYSLHAYPNQFTSAGLQTTDFLALLGFERCACPFKDGRQCYSIEVRPEVDLSNLPTAFDSA